MFTIQHDAATATIRVVRTGSADQAEAERYHAAMRDALSRAQGSGARFSVLIDISQAAPLPQDVAARFERVAADMRRSSLHRVAFISSAAINRLQAKRITSSDPRFRTFADADSAHGWLAEP